MTIMDEARERLRRQKREHAQRNGQARPSAPPPEEQHGDAWEGTPEPAPRQTAVPVGYRFSPIDSAVFAVADYRPTWLVKRMLDRRGSPVLSAPRANHSRQLRWLTLGYRSHREPLPWHVLCLPDGQGCLAIRRIRRTRLAGTALRVCRARDIDLAAIAGNLLWDFRLPQLARADDLAALQDGLQRYSVSVVIVDPLYLCLLAGQPDKGLSAASMYDMGPLFQSVAQRCLSIGCTPILVHHFRQTRTGYDEPQFEDLAFSGVQEFARQWILLSRRERYEPGTGQHRLWLTVGGSIGHSGLWHLDIEEGQLAEDFSGRQWQVTVMPIGEAKKQQAQAEDDAKQQLDAAKNKADDSRLLAALDTLDRERQGISQHKVRDMAGLSNPKMTRAVVRLVAERVIEELPVTAILGSGAKRPAQGIRRRPLVPSGQTIGTENPDGSPTIGTEYPPFRGILEYRWSDAQEQMVKVSERLSRWSGGYSEHDTDRTFPEIATPVRIRRDLFHCIDLIGVRPGCPVLGVQATTRSNISARLKKAKALPELAVWLRCGCEFSVHGWYRTAAGKWDCVRVGVQPGDLASVVLSAPRRRRGRGERQKELFA